MDNKALYNYYEGAITKAIQDLRNTCITAICVMVSNGDFNGIDGKPRTIMLHKDNQRLYIDEFAFNYDCSRVIPQETEVRVETFNGEEGEIYDETYILEDLPTEWLYEVYRYISRSF